MTASPALRVPAAAAGLMGAGGVALAAMSAHLPDATRLAAASSMLLFHAAAVLGVLAARDRLLLWHANYHPDGGQLFYPVDGCPFVTALALPGDDVTPEKFVAFHCDGSKGLYIHPNVWHEVIIPLRPVGRFFDRQGRIHGRVSVNFPKEFGVFLEVPLPGA